MFPLNREQYIHRAKKCELGNEDKYFKLSFSPVFSVSVVYLQKDRS